MKVRCISNFLWNDVLTVEKIYEANTDDSTGDEYWIIDDNDFYNPFPKYLFEEVE